MIHTLKCFWSKIVRRTDSFRWGFGGYYFLHVSCIPVKTKFASFLVFVGHVNIDWYKFVIWWRHQMDTFSALLALCAGNPPVTGEFPSQRPVTRSFELFYYLRLNIWLSKQSIRRRFETPSCPSWRHRNELIFWSVSCTSGCNRPCYMDVALCMSFMS